MDRKKRILFVDDQEDVLDGMRRMLHVRKDEWDMTFCISPKEALVKLDQQEFDLIVSDMMMPEMNGAQLLTIVAKEHPGIVRFILSGHSDRELILQSVGNAHQYITKPCDSERLKQYIANSFGLHSILAETGLHERIAKIKFLPSPPGLYNDIVCELQSETASIGVIADLISKDIGLSAKILQIVNSAFFGLPRRVEGVSMAVNFLGLNTVQALVLAAGINDQLSNTKTPPAVIEPIFRHSLSVGNLSKEIASALGLGKRDADDALIAGLMHDIGKLVLIVNFREEMLAVSKVARGREQSAVAAEREILGASHGEIGAHLLSLWGMHDPILEAVAFHNDPQRTKSQSVNILTAVYLANVIDQNRTIGVSGLDRLLDSEYLEKMGLGDTILGVIEDCQSKWIEEGTAQ